MQQPNLKQTEILLPMEIFLFADKGLKRKRAFDIAFSLLDLLLGWPLFLFLALLIKLSSKGPLFYGSIRVGLHGKKITCWKIRTMHVDAEEKLKDLLAKDPSLEKEWLSSYKLKKDPRIVPFGQFLRKTSLDELPQFLNVLKGDLSLVGPRPVSLEEARLFLAKKGPKFFSIRPGLTGLWQTSERNNMPYEKRMDLEEQYIDRRSFKLDLILIFKTIFLMIRPRGAF